MFRILLLFTIISLSCQAEAQYRLRKTQRGESKTHIPFDYSVYKKHHKGEVVLDAGFATLSRGLGLIYYLRGEYFINTKFSSRLNIFINSLQPNPEPQSYLQVTADVAYHFYQEKRFDVYTYLGFGIHRFRNQSSLGGYINNITPTINSGVGGRYRITPSFGIQLEFGRTSSLGLFKSLDFLRDS